jgi:SAM-dependent methyltransferase
VFDVRSNEAEVMDDLSLQGDELRRELASIEWVNAWLGGRRIFVDGVRGSLERLEARTGSCPFEVVDVGCGGGDGLRAVATWARRANVPLALRGVDANPAVLDFARERSRGFDEIEYERADVLAPTFSPRGADLVTFNLCLHHFEEAEIVHLLSACRRAGAEMLLVNDLQRHWLPWLLFYLVCVVCLVPSVARRDGLLSVRKGFRRGELERLAGRAGWQAVESRWRWAFRYQLTFVRTPRDAPEQAPPGPEPAEDTSCPDA